VSRASITVRRAVGDAEADAAGELTARAYRTDRLVEPDDTYLDELLDARRRAREATLLVATVPGASGDVVVGTITMAPAGTSYAETAEPGELELRMLAVAPEARGQGVAEALVRATFREAAVLGHRTLVLSTLDSMAAAQRLYHRLGWTRVPERDWGHVEIHLRVYTWRAPAAPGPLVERATWPPLRVERVAGFELGMSEGLTRRANCAVLTDGAWEELDGQGAEGAAAVDAADLDRRLASVEACFALAGLTPCVRVDLPSPSGSRPPTPAERVLTERGYRDVGDTLVLVRDLEAPAAGEPEEIGTDVRVEVADRPDEPWLALWGGDRAIERTAGAAILTGVPALYVSVVRDGEVAGVIRVCVVGARGADRTAARAWAGLSCLTVAPGHRGQGLAALLVRRALAEARAVGASHAFSQVLAHNHAAVTLHERLGFAVARAYRYAEPDVARVPEALRGPH